MDALHARRNRLSAGGARVVTLFATLFGVYQFTLSSLYGFLLVAVLSYLGAPWLFDVTPLGPGELLLFLGSLDSTLQSAILSSTITVFGFLAAFDASNSTWRRQERALILLDVANTITRLSENACAALAALKTTTDTPGSSTEAASRATALLALTEARRDISLFRSRHFVELARGLLLTEKVDDIAQLLDCAQRAALADVGEVGEVGDNDDAATRHRLSEVCDAATVLIAANYQFIRAQLLSPVVGMSAMSYLNLLRRHGELAANRNAVTHARATLMGLAAR